MLHSQYYSNQKMSFHYRKAILPIAVGNKREGKRKENLILGIHQFQQSFQDESQMNDDSSTHITAIKKHRCILSHE
jgi:hypothetical protein